MEQKQAFFDFEDITGAAKALREQIDSAYNLMCIAPRMDELELHTGDDLDTVRLAVDLRRAEIVDAELAPMRPKPAPDTPTWTIDYDEHGGFVATSSDQTGDGTTPWKFWGSAATADSAAHTLTWYFLDRPPHIDFDPPQIPRPCARTGPDSDRSREGPSVLDLLKRRGPIYEQHLTACRSAREVLREHPDDIKSHLAKRAAQLNTTDPQLDEQSVLNPLGSPRNHDHDGFAITVQWVPTHLVVGTDHRRWGDFGDHRPYIPFDIVQGLLTNDLDAFIDELFGRRITLLRTPAWAGPLYRVGENGNHRIHTARMLNLPWLAAAVAVEATAPSWDMLDLITDDPDTTSQRDQPFEKRIHDRTLLVAGLIRREIIDGELTDNGPQPTLHCHRLPAAWLLRPAQFATKVNAVYESRYPGALAQLGIPIEVGTDPDAWTRWLTAT
ncbi:hypothetical protein [Amycolatopsis saalfeldensis]|uniref:hypothetical protein n=1 Tax=Amycolatopsis saalfeldensis TaxID=394193 RepID=UPI0011605988|nr:hypothetical protein [Amycolatopsis saalfeldensis]